MENSLETLKENIELLKSEYNKLSKLIEEREKTLTLLNCKINLMELLCRETGEIEQTRDNIAAALKDAKKTQSDIQNLIKETERNYSELVNAYGLLTNISLN